jgi:hypothetical protein
MPRSHARLAARERAMQMAPRSWTWVSSVFI